MITVICATRMCRWAWKPGNPIDTWRQTVLSLSHHKKIMAKCPEGLGPLDG
jgi:hypothetical protein